MSYQCPLDLGIICNFDFKTLTKEHTVLAVAALSYGQGRHVHSKEPNLEIISRHVSCQFMHIGKIKQNNT